MSGPLSITISPELDVPAAASVRTLLDLSSSVLLACEPDGRVVWANKRVLHVLEHELDVVVGHGLAELVHPDDQPAMLAALHRISSPSRGATDESVGVRARARHRDESWHPLEWTVRQGSGRHRLVLLAGRDVSDRRAAADAALTGEAWLRAFVEHSPSPVFVQDLAGRYLLLNEEWAALAGSTSAGMLGLTDDRCLADYASMLADMRRTVVVEGNSVTRDIAVPTPAGLRHHVLTEFGLRDDNGDVYATCGIATDITDRERVATSLGERERVLETVLEASPDIISLLDAEGRVARVSAAGRAIFGEGAVPHTSGDLFPYVHPDDFDEVASNFIRLATGSTTRVRAQYRTEDAEGRWVTLDTRWQALVDEAGRFTGAVVVARDVSRRLESEQRLRELRQAAEEASRAKSDFLSRMSHELRTPLNSILGFAQLLDMDDLPVHQAEAVHHILRGGRHLLEVIEEVLDISRLETGNLELSSRPVLLEEIVTEAVESLTQAAARADVTIDSMIPRSDGPAVLGDRRRLAQVIHNLLSNAVKYNRPGGRVDVSCQASPGDRVRLAVADTGRGIRAENLGRVFEPFDRLGAEQSGIEGTGAGLALAQKLVERMGGTLTVESVPEVGSTFTIELPVAVIPSSGSVALNHGSAEPSSAFRVLLVEGDLGSLALLERALSRRPGVVVEGATRGRVALDMVRSRRPELILVDLHLPDMPVSALLAHLGDDADTAAIPVAVLSSMEAAGQMRTLLGRGVAGQLTKPVDPRALLSLVDAVRSASGR